MSLKEVLIDIIIPLISGFIGGTIGSIGTIKKDNRKVNNKNALYNNIGEVYNGDRNR